MTENPKLTKKSFMSDQEIKWCPGCGDYAILAATQSAMAKIGVPPHEVCVVSGIGCSSRFPYYVSTYGMHSIHGRAPAVASGVKLQNPDLSVWIITGDGDGLSIGGNHLAHILRRNLDVNIILFNNEIYGLTKGQYSPTSQPGTTTKSSPFGSFDRPFSPAKFALGSGASFFARTIDTDPKHMMEVFMKAAAHKGTSLIEVFQNCIIFNDGVHNDFTDRKIRDENTVRVTEGEPLIFGADKDKGLTLNGFDFETVAPDHKDLIVHDPSNKNLASLLCNLDGSNGPIPLGVIQQVEASIYEEELFSQIKAQKDQKGPGKMSELLMSGNTWEVN
ncbi:MAG: 2-oxoacid:ferredoxin oxidoreductase subunit beta [Halobacteriovoraceae bacterium]|nr:2-oxoacid:ferredoxin oxidoreductase subunit beta [Halobacteriovoraceae bacterium]|tara:strand:+ start:4177 stop:5172 length:996 start_codon:yes stop_codon:yes gene_type:complete